MVLALGASLDEQQVRDAFTQRHTKYKLPKRVIFAADLPRHAMGKVQKTCLFPSRAIVLEPKFIDLDEPAPVLVMPIQAHPLRNLVAFHIGPYATLTGTPVRARNTR